MATFFKAPTSNYWSTTLNGAINDSVETITLTSTSGLQYPGVIVIDRVNSAGTATPASREVISYTGISSSDLTGCTRGAENSTNRAHLDGAVVEAVFTVSQWSDLRDSVAKVLSTDGTNIAVTGTASVAVLNSPAITTKTIAMTSVASINTGNFTNFTATNATVYDGSVWADTMGANSIASIAWVSSANVLSSAATITSLNYVAKNGAVNAASDGATVTFNCDLGNIHTVTLGGNRTLALSNVNTGQAFVIRLLQDGTGSRTVTWFSTIKWPDNTAPTLTTTAAKADVFGFICTGTNTYDGFIIGQNL